MIIKKKDSSALYLTCGQVLIPFLTWDSFEPDFSKFPILEVTEDQFKKFTVSDNAIITKK